MSQTLRLQLGDLLLDRECVSASPDEIESWVDAWLNGDRTDAWEQHRQNCPSCQELYDDASVFQRLLSNPLGVASEARAFEACDPRVRKAIGLDRPRGRRKVSSWLWFSIPATLLAALVAVVFWPGGSDRLFDQVDTVAFVAPPLVRGTTAEQWQEADQAWASEDYASAAAALEEIWQSDAEATDAGFYLGVAQLKDGRTTEAIDTLSTVDQAQAEFPSEWTRWMLAIAHDQQGDRDAVCETLERVVELDGERSDEARAKIEEGCR